MGSPASTFSVLVMDFDESGVLGQETIESLAELDALIAEAEECIARRGGGS